jgi:hypothetical protein
MAETLGAVFGMHAPLTREAVAAECRLPRRGHMRPMGSAYRVVPGETLGGWSPALELAGPITPAVG